ncbi:CXXC-type zinc finger protein 1-like [Clytia hemisphaerica]|uniref:CXXC-type zinc finger protein 1 n=1 Tax=Clytia hemisphaerica TaxID=252671 RepID=A0A7M5VEX6_9CNID
MESPNYQFTKKSNDFDSEATETDVEENSGNVSDKKDSEKLLSNEDDEQEEEIVDSDFEKEERLFSPVKQKTPVKKEGDVTMERTQEYNSDGEEIYCVCRSADIDRFMIACDKCGEWFHGDCIGLKKKHAKKIKDWFCNGCKKLDPNLQTIYKEKKEKKIKVERMDSTDSRKDQKDKEHKDKEQKRISRSCGECSACLIKEDCSTCDYCKDMRKYGGPGKLRQKCRLRQCHNLSKILKGSQTAGNKKKSSKSKDSRDSRQGSDKEESKSTSNSNNITTDHSYTMPASSFNTPTLTKPSSSMKRPRESESDYQPSDHALDEGDGDSPNDDTDYEPEQKKKKMLKVKRANVKKDTSQRNKESKTTNKSSNNRKKKSNTSRGKKNDDAKLATKLQKMEYLASRSTRSNKKDPSSTHRKEKEKEVYTPKHCLGPGCVNAAKLNSKYCSNECGVQLQIRRLQVILPTRGINCSKIYNATVLAEGKIQKYKRTQQECQEILLALDKEYKQLDGLIQKSKGLTIKEENQNEEDKDGDIDLTTYCVSCGIPLAPRIAFRHMEKCWAKLECLMSFGAIQKSAGNLFCDTFMVQQGTYCKRLKIMCPEHYKEGKIEANEVCGCPLVDDQQKETNKFCRQARKKCIRHVAWQRLRKGEIDLKRVHQWWKLEEAYEQERQQQIEISNRRNVLAVLLNDTFDHNYNRSPEKVSLSSNAQTFDHNYGRPLAEKSDSPSKDIKIKEEDEEDSNINITGDTKSKGASEAVKNETPEPMEINVKS